MTYKQLGNGGAFDYLQTNSSFLIENNDKYILFDCGYSVFAELRRQDADINNTVDLKKLDTIYISHMDDDHVGSLKSLLYYQYFVNGISTTIIGHKNILDSIQAFLGSDFNQQMTNGKYVPADIVAEMKEAYTDKIIEWNNTTIALTNTSHHTECYGITILQEEGNQSIGLFITGDTKATPYIRNVISNIKSTCSRYQIFHDFSNWDCEGSQVHACKSDTEILYSEQTRGSYTKYHNGEVFKNIWVKL